MALGVELLNGTNGHAVPSVVEAKVIAATTAAGAAEHRPADLDVCRLGYQLGSSKLTFRGYRPQN